MVRRIYNLAAVLAVVHMTALVGAVGVFVANGTLTKARAQRIASVLRGEEDKPKKTMPDAPTGKTENSSTMAPEKSVVVPVVQSPEDLEVLRREAERIATELEQRRALTHGALLNITTQRDELQKDRESFMREKEAASKRTADASRDSEGFRKQIELFDGLNPKVAMEHLLGLKDIDEAALVLSSLETRKANKIVESAKTSAQMQKMQEIMQRVRDVAASDPQKSVPKGESP